MTPQRNEILAVPFKGRSTSDLHHCCRWAARVCALFCCGCGAAGDQLDPKNPRKGRGGWRSHLTETGKSQGRFARETVKKPPTGVMQCTRWVSRSGTPWM
eukprot:2006018-Rhodomonas_salina.1